MSLAIAVMTVVVALTPGVARAANSLSVEVFSGPNLVVDSNVTSPSTYAPRAGYIGARICNTSDPPAVLQNVTAYIGDQGGLGAGLFPAWDSTGDPRAFIANTGSYALTLEAGDTGTADGTRYIGTLAAGECRMQYWLFSYPQCVNVPEGGSWVADLPPCATSITGGVKPDDDVTLWYDVWATADATPTVTETREVTLRNEISAAANKIWPNTTSKVPDEYLSAIESVLGWGTLGPDGQPLTAGNAVYPGQRVITTQGIWYDLGNVGAGFDNDGDLVPDQNAWLQPIGDPAAFDAGCFRLVKVYGVVIVKLKSGGELLIPFQDRLYFQGLPDNTGVVGLVYYQYVATGYACTGSLTPYQEAASGFDNEKFSADYGLGLGLQSADDDAALTLDKTGSDTDGLALGGLQTYTLAAGNPGTGVNIGAPDLGLPLTLSDSVPAGTTYQSGSATVVSGPTAGQTGNYTQGYTVVGGGYETCPIDYRVTAATRVIQYSTDEGATWSTTDPGASTTDIRWSFFTTIELDGGHDGRDCIAPDAIYPDGTVETSLPAGMSASVRFQVQVNSTAPLPGPIVCNVGGLGFGSAAPGQTAEYCNIVTGSNTLSGTVFKDNGTGVGGVTGNGVQDGTEGGIGPGVVVTLYYDRNGDGALDAGDIKYGSETSTNAAGDYSFSNLPDGQFLVVLKKYDGTDAGDGSNNAATDSFYGTAGWGNTTFDPNLPLTTDDGVLKLSEDLATATLAVNLDYARNTGGAVNVATADFGFAPPLRVTKTTAAPTVPEGTFTYTILLENLLPSVGKQGSTGCEYTVWAPTGVNGPAGGNKDFTNPGDAWDGPNRQVASALVEGGGNREIDGRSFRIADQAGSITRVEALYFGYYGQTLDDDSLAVSATFGGSTSTGTVVTSTLDNFVGPPADLDPDSAISWDITALRPPGGSWSWADDFSTLVLYVNPKKSTAADNKYFYLDAIGLRITTDADCEAGPSTTLSPVPLRDRFDTTYLSFLSADPEPTSVSGGTILWDDVGPILPGGSRTVTVTMRTPDVTGTLAGSCAGVDPNTPPGVNSICNLVEAGYGTSNVRYLDGRKAQDQWSATPVSIAGLAEIRGFVWRDTTAPTGDGWAYDLGEPYLPGVTVSLFACMRVDGVTLEPNVTNKLCVNETAGNFWALMGTAVTDANGAYEFIGLAKGTYIVEVGDTDGAPGGGNAPPYGGTQTAEPNDSQAVDGGGNATGTAGVCAGAGGCNNTWGNPAANLNTMNQLGNTLAEETINGVNFGYYLANATIYGKVWEDVDGDAAYPPETGEPPLAGFTVQRWSDPNGDGDIADGTLQATTTTDAGGNYSFTGLGAGSYVIVVVPTRPIGEDWDETYETTGGTGSLDNQIPVTVAAGQFSGSHDFGYTRSGSSDIGDTVYFDLDADGVQDAAEAGIPDVTVRLYEDVDRDGSVDPGVDDLLATDVTDTAGRYLFTGLAGGSYVVEVDTADPDFPDNVTPTGDPDVPTGRIGGRICLDDDGNGACAGDDGIAGVVVHLYANTDGDGTVDPGEPLVAAVVTDVTGGYTFTGLVAGNWLVEVDEATLPKAALVTALRLTRTTAAFSNIALATNSSTYTTADAGYSPAATYALGNRVWSDADGDNAQDPGETGIAGVRITVLNNGGGASGCPAPGCTVVTDAAGFWYVTGLTNGTYSVDVDPGGTANYLRDPRDFLLTGGTEARNFTISGADRMDADFGYRYSTDATVLNDRDTGDPTGTIDGRVFVDADGDGLYGRSFAATTTNGSATVTTATPQFTAADVGRRIEGTGIPLGATITVFTSTTSVTISANATASGTSTRTVSADPPRTGATVNLLDPDGSTVATTTTNANGRYYFGSTATCNMTQPSAATGCSGVFVGQYTVEAVDPLGTRYSVLFLNTSQSIAGLDVVFAAVAESTPDSRSGASVDGIHDNLLQDFGYRRFQGTVGDTVYWDVNENGTQDVGEPGIAGTTVRLSLCGWADANGDRLFQAGEQLGCPAALASTVTTADVAATPADEGGRYLFSNLDAPTAARSFTGATTLGSATVTSAGLFLATDVGTAISGPGIPTGAYLVSCTSTSSCTMSAPATATAPDTVPDPDVPAPILTVGQRYYLVTVDTGTLPGTAELIADPDADGAACPDLPAIDDPDDEYPPPSVCDDRHLVPAFGATTNYLGADFGYQVTGSGYGTIGDRVWIDTNGNGVYDDGEQGVPWITLWFDANGDWDLDWTDTNLNGAWDSGEGERWVETDADGSYLFSRLADGTYVNLRVLNGTPDGDPELERDPDWPAGLPETPTYEARLTNTGSLDSSVSVTIASGLVTTLDDGFAGNDPDTCAGCNLDADFGYRYTGSFTLSGTICTETFPGDGNCGGSDTTYSGVGAGESPLAGILVGLYLWTDAGDPDQAWSPGSGALDGADSFTFIGSTSTNADGDYSFANVPTGKLVVVLSVSETQNLDLTTTQANTSLEPDGGSATSRQLHEGSTTYEGRPVTVIARQAIEITGSARDLDFAFDGSLGGTIAYDYGDLPIVSGDLYATLLADGGARHLVPASPTIYLGSGVTANTDGQPSADAGWTTTTGDQNGVDATEEDGIVLDFISDSSVLPGTGRVYANASADGWLGGWVDWNQDGDFADAGEFVADQPVTAGWNLVDFDVPIVFSATLLDPYELFARFRIYPSRPLLTASTGLAVDAAFQPVAGEVEDYFWNVAVTKAVVASFSACDAGGATGVSWRTASEVRTAGFFLERRDGDGTEFRDAAGGMLPALVASQRGGAYRFLDRAADPGLPRAYRLVEVETGGRRIVHGPFAVDAAEPCAAPFEDGFAGAPPPVAVRAAAAAPAAGVVASAAPVDRAKILTGEGGIHVVSTADLAAALGRPETKVRRLLLDGAVGLENRGRKVALLPTRSGTAAYFHAEELDSSFARDNAYWAVVRKKGALRMATRDEDAAGKGKGTETFPRTARAEVDAFPAHELFADARLDHWFWDYLFVLEPPKTFTVRADGAAGTGEATLSLLLTGAIASGVDLEHHAEVRLNGVLAGEARWSGLASVEARFSVDPALLSDGDNVVEVAALGTASPYDVFYLDSVELAYRSRYRAVGDRLAFAAGGNRVLRVSGFSSRDVLVFDVTDPARPVRVKAAVFATGEGEYGFDIRPRRRDARYEALTRAAAVPADRIAPARPWKLPAAGSPYLVVTAAPLRQEAERIAARRGGLVVDLEDVYDAYGHGIPSPYALRDFLQAAWRRWRVRPAAVLIAGDGSYDYRDNLGMGGNLVPPMLVGTVDGLAPSDTWFADVAGGPAPEMAVGRLPAQTPEELRAMFDKVVLREESAGADWGGRLLALADDADDAGDFPAGSDRLADLAPAGAVKKVYVGTMKIAKARAELAAGLRAGAGLTSYVGHGGYDLLAAEELLTSADVPALGNAGAPTVLAALTCVVNDFTYPYESSLGERLVLEPAGGAAAVWAPSGLVRNQLSLQLAERFHGVYHAGAARTLGEAVLGAMRAYEGTGSSSALGLYVLLGDPGMRLR